MKKVIIVAVSRNGIMGRTSGEMPWHSKEEFQHFKNTTLGFPVIMGRKTFDSLGKPLSGRLNIVLTKNKNFQTEYDEVKIFSSLNEAYRFCENLNFIKVFVIGGSFIIREALDDIDEMIISVMDFDAEGDVLLPDYNKDDFELVTKEKRSEFEVLHFIRKN